MRPGRGGALAADAIIVGALRFPLEVAMANSWRRRALRSLLAFAALLALVVAFVAISSQRRLQRDYALKIELGAPDPALAEQGIQRS